MRASPTMRQAVIRSPTTFTVETVPRPELRSGEEVLIRTAACGICSGDLMAWYLERKVGTVLGHEVVGYAEEVGREVRHVKPGQLVFVHHHAPCGDCRYCRAGDPVQCATWRASRLDPGGMAEFIRVPAENVRSDTFPIDDLAPEAGIFIEPLACSVKALSRLDGGPRETGVIVGCGVMGLLNLMAARALGTRTLWAVEPDPDRRERALRCGADEALAPGEAARKIAADLEGADFVIVGPGDSGVIRESLAYVRSGGSVVLFTPTPAGCATLLDLNDLYFRELRLVPSYSCGPRDTRQAYDLLRRGAVNARPLITHSFSIERVQEAYDTAKRGGKALKVLVVFEDPAEEASDEGSRV